MAQHSLSATVGQSENVLSFVRPSAPDCGATALNLVYQAAEIFSSIENHARETEARAQSLCQSAVERLKGAERARLEIINEADCKLQEAARALKDAQSRIVAAEDKLTAVEFRAQAAELEAREAKQALTLVEEAIRRRLLRKPRSCQPVERSSLTFQNIRTL
jgi:chromosome condensin MukBEF complex kleisin-like MukF subunit